jgi:murein DD-endopeptidase MepM/ murein hydrolase activator NlpD
VQGNLLDDHIVAGWRSALDAQKTEIARLEAQANREGEAVGRRLAVMHARLLRMEALGERLSEVADIDAAEFRFGEAPAVGGPELGAGEGSATADFTAQVASLSRALESREDELELLESLLSNRKFHQAVALSGRPVTKGWMSSGFGRRVDPITGRMAWHAGIDFAGEPGADVIAVASGVVIFAGERSGYGRMVEINHGGGYVTRYGHHEGLLVAAGDVVKKGQVIARMGNTGRSTGTHVHFEVLKDGRQVNPAQYIARRA